MAFHNHQRKAKRRRVAILYARSNARRRPMYGSLLAATRDTLAYLDDAHKVLENQSDAEAWCAKVQRIRPLIVQVIAQTQRRIIDGERVPAADKIVSLPGPTKRPAPRPAMRPSTAGPPRSMARPTRRR